MATKLRRLISLLEASQQRLLYHGKALGLALVGDGKANPTRTSGRNVPQSFNARGHLVLAHVAGVDAARGVDEERAVGGKVTHLRQSCTVTTATRCRSTKRSGARDAD